MIDIELLKQELFNKENENKAFNKRYWIEQSEDNVFVHKEAEMPRISDKLCVQQLIKYYREMLRLPFQYIEKGNRVEYISPLVDTIQQVRGRTSLADPHETSRVLNEYESEYTVVKNNVLKPECTLRVYVSNDYAENYFTYLNHDYILDLEEFYFCIYDKNGKNIGIDGLDSDKLDIYRVKNYIPKCASDKSHLLRENMLVYG